MLRHLPLILFLSIFSSAQVCFAMAKKPRAAEEGIELAGSPEFIARTRAALKLLEDANLLTAMVRPYVVVIEEAKRSGMRAFARKPTYEVGRPTWESTPIWYAGTIVHDACHSRLYREAKAGRGRIPWMGTEAERACLKDQYDALARMSADRYLLEYVADLMKNPTYQGDAASLSDYYRRKW